MSACHRETEPHWWLPSGAPLEYVWLIPLLPAHRRGCPPTHFMFHTHPSAHGRYSYWWSFAIAMALVNAGLEPTKLAFYDAENFS